MNYLLPDALLACFIEVTVVGGGKILVLLEVLLLLLPLIADAFNGLLCVLVNPWVASVGASNDINTALKGPPSVRSTTPIAMKNVTAGHATGLVGPFISALILTDGLLSLAGIYLGGKCLPCATGFTSGNGPDVSILHLGTDGCLEHLMEGFALVSGRVHL